MKTLNLFVIGVFLLLPCLADAQAYHIDPNTGTAITGVATRSIDPSINGIIITNSATADMSILLSDDKIKWDTVRIPKGSNLSYPSKIKYIKLYTSATKLTYALLNAGYAYTIYWDSSNTKWDIK